MKLKLKGSEETAGTESGSGSNVGTASLVRVHNSGTTQRLVSLETSAAALIGTFTISGGATEFLDKDPTDEIFVDEGLSGEEILLVKVAYYS
jgi:hypothetical protein|tara:strand:+ start:285 stop:560 length:276 start_codon:yes stop_codon:yes gene_type:complete